MYVMVTTIGIMLNLVLFSAVGFYPVFLLSSSGNRLATCVAIAPTMGFAIISLATTYLILLDYPVQVWADIFSAISIVLVLIILFYQLLKKRFTRKIFCLSNWSVGWLLSGFVITAIMVILPMALGGINFTTFRGNGSDTFNYMTMAGYLDREAYSWKNTATREELMNNDRSYTLAVNLLDYRWTTSAMLAYTSRVAKLPIYQFEYSYTLLFFIMSFGPSYIIGRCLKLNRMFAFLVALVIGVGFWAQFVLDTRAFSQINSIPLVLSISYFFVNMVNSRSPQINRESVLLGILVVSLLFSYIEIVPLCLLGGFLFLMFLNRKKEHWLDIIKPLCVTLLLIAVGTAPLYTSLGKFILNAINYAANASNDWDTYYFPWLYSNPIIGFWGLTPLACSSCWPNSLELGKVFEIILIVLGGLLSLGTLVSVFRVLFRESSNIPLVYVICFACATCIEFLLLYKGEQLWAAGKALAFGYPFFILLLAGIGLGANILPVHPLIYRMFRLITISWIILQIFIGFARSYVSTTVGDFANYIVNHGNYRKHNYDLSPIISVLENKQGETIWTIIPDRWFAEYTNLALGVDYQVVDVFGVYDRKNNFVGFQEMKNNPTYVLIDPNALSYNKGWEDKFTIVARASDLFLLAARETKFVFLLITNPNGIENWDGKAGFWIGNGQTVLDIISTDSGQAVFVGDFMLGPSISGLEQRKLEIIDNGVGDVQIYKIGNEKREFFFMIRRGNNRFILNALDLPTTSILPNGDQRTLLLGVTNINIQLVK